MNILSKFQHRSEEEEIMDDLTSNGEVLERTLVELDFINTYLGGNATILNSLKKLFATHSGKTITIADLGCGSGTLLMHVADLAMEYKVDVKLTGVDANEFIIQYAKRNTASYTQIEFQQLNVLGEEFLNRSYDVIICSLFCHHFNNIELSNLLKCMYSNAKLAVIISDLHRHWFAYYSINSLTYLFSSSPMVKYDAGVSVLRAFKRNELLSLLEQIGVKKYTLKWKWAFRYELMIDCSKN